MLSKQGWKLLNDPSSLVSKLYKAKYFPQSSFFKAKLGTNLSYVWSRELKIVFFDRFIDEKSVFERHGNDFNKIKSKEKKLAKNREKSPIFPCFFLVLDYLLSCSSTYTTGNRKTVSQKSGDHPPLFNCNCFRCYTSYWVKWDSSSNRQLIHEIIDAFEDGLVQSKNPKSRKEGEKGSPGQLSRNSQSWVGWKPWRKRVETAAAATVRGVVRMEKKGWRRDQ